MRKSPILLLGKTPPPFMGPAIATQIILNSSLGEHFRLIHVETRLNKDLRGIGAYSPAKVFRLAFQYIDFIFKLIFRSPQLVVVPISQSWGGFRKDSVFIRMAAAFNRKCLVHLRGSNFLNFYNALTPAKQKFISNTLAKTSGAIVLGRKLHYIFEPFFSPDQIFVVPNGANYNFKASIPQYLNSSSPLSIKFRVNEENNPLPTSSFQLLYLGNLQPSKGILDVVNAYTQLNLPDRQAGSSTTTHLHIVGKWRDQITRDEVHKILTEYNFKPINAVPPSLLNTSVHQFLNSSGNTISFLSVLSGQNKLDLLASSNLLIFPPREPEGHPWVIIEAMAAGLPIITTDQGAITESVIDGVNGFIVEPNHPEGIAEKIRFLLNNPEVRLKMGQESRRLYEEKFTEEIMVENLIRVFHTVLDS